MNIGIDARIMGPNSRGIGRYIERLLLHLSKIDNTNKYTVFTRKESAHLVPNKMKTIITDIHWYTFAEQIKLRKVFDAEKLDIIHIPHWNAPLFLKTPLTITIHDMILWEHPSLAATTLSPIIYWAKYFFYRIVVSQIAKRAKIVFTVSNSAKNSILRNLKISPEKIIVTPLGIDPFVPASHHSSLPNPPIEQKEMEYILSVGSGYPHKNIKTFFKVAKELMTTDYNLRAVIAGTDPAFIQRLKNQGANILGKNIDRVNFVGMISDDELGVLYKNAKALIFTSQAEGFGLPPMEAVLCGVPVIASNIDTSREMFGNSIPLVNPTDVSGFANAYRKITTDLAYKSSILTASKKQGERYSWEQMAQTTIKAFQQTFPLL